MAKILEISGSTPMVSCEFINKDAYSKHSTYRRHWFLKEHLVWGQAAVELKYSICLVNASC